MLKYGLEWPNDASPLNIELKLIQEGGNITVAGRKYGNGLPFHYETARQLMWPRLDDHRWHRLCRDNILNNKVTVLLGPGSSGKTHEAAWIYLVEYFCWPEETCVLVSSTDLRGLRLRVWGEIAMLWQEAVEKFPFLPGHLLESRIAITTDEMSDGEYSDRKVRDMRKGIVGIPTVQSGKFVGLGKWIGIKQKRLRLIADEASAMGSSFLSAFANLNKNEDFRAIIIGNPSDPLDPLGKAAEPLDGWSGHLQPEKTEVWKTRFMNGTCVNLIGTDSPNFDFPSDQPARYKYLISRQKIADTLSFFPKDSFEYYSQCVGCMKVGTLDDRIITRDLCRNFGALEPVIWKGTEIIKVCALDAAYGGDRAVCGHIEFGQDVNGQTVIAFNPPQIVPVTATSATSPEQQLAVWVKEYCERNEILPDHFFHDSTGRGGLGTAIAHEWSSECNPVEFGGGATDRPVAVGLYTYDMETHTKRLVRCNEHYDRLVTELWYQFRYAIQARQIRSLPEDVMDELCMRKWERKRLNNRITIETKQVMKERIGRSPDLGDWACWVPGTLISTPTGLVPIEKLSVGDWVLTPYGPSRISIVHRLVSKRIFRASFSNGTTLEGTPNHRIFIWGKGWVPIEKLSIDNRAESVQHLPIWTFLNALFTMEEPTSFKHLADTIRMETGGVCRGDFYTELSGKSTTGQFLSSIVSITKMVDGGIIALAIWRLSQFLSIVQTICDCVGRRIVDCLCNGFRRLSPEPQSGTDLRGADNGTRKMPNVSGSTLENTLGCHVPCAERSSGLETSLSPSTVETHARTGRWLKGIRTMLGSALSAAKCLLLYGIEQRQPAPVLVEPLWPTTTGVVLNLTLQSQNAYYANGILVENCLCLEGARRLGFIIEKLPENGQQQGRENDYLEDELRRYKSIVKKRQLRYT